MTPVRTTYKVRAFDCNLQKMRNLTVVRPVPERKRVKCRVGGVEHELFVLSCKEVESDG